MCYFIAIGVPAAGAEMFTQTVSHPFKLDECRNPSLLSASPPRYRLFWLHLGPCGCGLYATPRDQKAKEQALRKKYAKYSWSAAKLERAIVQKLSREHPAGLWSPLVDALLTRIEDFKELTLLVHWFSGQVDEEVIVVQGQMHCTANAFPDMAKVLHVKAT